MVRVLPDPAPAMTNLGPSPQVTAARCASFSSCSRSRCNAAPVVVRSVKVRVIRRTTVYREPCTVYRACLPKEFVHQDDGIAVEHLAGLAGDPVAGPVEAERPRLHQALQPRLLER